MMWPSQTKDPWINICRIDNGNDMTTLHVMNWGRSPLGVEEDEVKQAVDVIKKMKRRTQPMRCDEMQ